MIRSSLVVAVGLLFAPTAAFVANGSVQAPGEGMIGVRLSPETLAKHFLENQAEDIDKMSRSELKQVLLDLSVDEDLPHRATLEAARDMVWDHVSSSPLTTALSQESACCAEFPYCACPKL